MVHDKPQKVEHFHLGSFHFGEITYGPPVKSYDIDHKMTPNPKLYLVLFIVSQKYTFNL